jgi:hypothetical protein
MAEIIINSVEDILQLKELLSRHGMVKSVWADPFSDVISMYPHF